ncbi:DEAD/DEAH box helicase [Parahaliea sp. F7430]|uniref:DEAD/DEAH box helicase n=1 Tax=Sediminihaliea albiluteola TaxID=2758564 RepID=A0A7W2TTU1_9GAMM|nr:DEAD/DEAH box helicase [Sediminihaliea albiluteola]MBA6411864.1 DEAD/DEAH box helicase [Sediminihaliea albiluteola]
MFNKLGLSDYLLRAIEQRGYQEPTPVQRQAIPPILAGRDLMVTAQTGTGKTAAFTLPILQRLAQGASASAHHCRALILAPTRELAMQIESSVADYACYLSITRLAVVGGMAAGPQLAALRKGVDLLIATPGRLLDLQAHGALEFSELEVLVLDEADRMLDLGFSQEIEHLLSLLPKKRQTLMFSATFSPVIRHLAQAYLKNPVKLQISPARLTANQVSQWVYPVDKKRKLALLCHLIERNDWQRLLVFTRTRLGAQRLSEQLSEQGVSSAAIHGNRTQAARNQALEAFKQDRIQVLVATDVAARGLDIEGLPLVVNFDLPSAAQDYVHRIGRTGRAKAAGCAYSLVSADEIDNLWQIEKLICQKLPREEQEGFEPRHALPVVAKQNKSARHKKGSARRAATAAKAASPSPSLDTKPASGAGRPRPSLGGRKS